MVKLEFYVPESHLESVKQAVFTEGAGQIGEYAECCWQTRGEGQYRPLEASDPAFGERGVLNKVVEYKVEMVCADQYISAAIQALIKAHPYEEPAYQIWKLAESS